MITFAADPADRVPDEAVRGDAVALRDAAGAQLRGRHALARPQAPHPAQAPPPLAGEHKYQVLTNPLEVVTCNVSFSYHV